MIKNKIKSIWNKWKVKVDKHNEGLGYACQEECWDYETIFYPILTSLIIVGFFWFLSVISNNVFSFKTITFLYLGVLSISYVFLFLNWKCYD